MAKILQIKLSNESAARYYALKKKVEAESDEEVIKNALRLYEALAQAEDHGKIPVVLVRATGKFEAVFDDNKSRELAATLSVPPLE